MEADKVPIFWVEKLLLKVSELVRGSCSPTPVFKPYILLFATDVVVVAINYSKENIKDGVVDSPLN